MNFDNAPPQKLAGPDDLPWTSANPSLSVTQAPDNSTETPQRAPSEPAAAETPRKKSPVRTIWSRDGKVSPEVSASRNADRAAQPLAQDAAKATLPQLNSGSQNTGPTADADAPQLPHFKIGPATPQPSHLGGPADVLPAVATPTARFKQITIEPDPNAVAADQLKSSPCRVLTASYGGKKTLLVRATVNRETRYTALTVLDGFEKSMFETYAKAAAPGAEIVGEYPSKDEALADAKANCPDR